MPKAQLADSTLAWTDAGSRSRRRKLATSRDPCRCARPFAPGSCETRAPAAQKPGCSIGFRSARCRFSTMVISIACSSDTWRRIAGMVVFPACCEARQRRSPAINWKRPLASAEPEQAAQRHSPGSSLPARQAAPHSSVIVSGTDWCRAVPMESHAVCRLPARSAKQWEVHAWQK